MKTLSSVFLDKNFKAEQLYQQNRTNYPDGIFFFVEMNKVFPSNSYLGSIKMPNIVNVFTEKYKLIPENIIVSDFHEKKDEKSSMILNSFTFVIDKDLLVTSFSDGNEDMYGFRLYYCHTTNKERLNEVTNFIQNHYEQTKNSEIGIIGEGQNGLFIRFFKVNVPDININSYYNDDFVDIHQKIMSKLNGNSHNKGVVLFHGKPGTGKCVDGSTVVTLRNKKTNEIENISIEKFENLI